MNAHRSVLARALVAKEDADVRATPLRILALAVEALLCWERKDISVRLLVHLGLTFDLLCSQGAPGVLR